MRGSGPTRDPLAIGLIGFAVLAAITYLGFTKRIPFTQGYRVDAVFQSSNQLRKGSPVRIAGVDVGRIVGLRGGPGSTTIVTMEIADRGRPVHRDATLRIRPRLFLEGGYYVELSPGTPTAREIDSGDRPIPLGQTSVPVQFFQILNTLNRPTRASLQSTFKELSIALNGGGAQALGRTLRPLAPTLRDTTIVAQAARGAVPGDLPQLIDSLSRVTGALAANDRALAGLITNLNRTSRAFASQHRALSVSVRQLDAVLHETPATLHAVDRVLPPVERFSRSVRPTLRRLPGDLDQASNVLVQLRALVTPRELPAAIDKLEPAARELPPLTRRLIEGMHLAKPIADCLVQRAIPVLKSELDDGRHSTGDPVWVELARGMVGLSSIAQSFDGNGYWVRYYFGGLDTLVPSGPIPGLGDTIGLAERPIIGQNPLWFGPGSEPPLRADQPCRDQPFPDLTARTGLPLAGPTTSSTRRSRGRLSRNEVEEIVTRVRRAVEQTRQEADR